MGKAKKTVLIKPLDLHEQYVQHVRRKLNQSNEEHGDETHAQGNREPTHKDLKEGLPELHQHIDCQLNANKHKMHDALTQGNTTEYWQFWSDSIKNGFRDCLGFEPAKAKRLNPYGKAIYKQVPVISPVKYDRNTDSFFA